MQRLGLSSEIPLTVAFSGGVDSCVLLHALWWLREAMPRHITAVHVDHGLHPDSAEWAVFAKAICDGLNVPCAVERIRVSGISGHGLEAAARRERYACLARYVSAGEVLLTGHHLDDQAETLLLQLLRGAGVHGLAAMPEMKTFSAGRIGRPLLGFTRSQLMAYAEQQKLKWIDDTSNDDTRFSRNYLRHRVFPLLEHRWPGAARQIARSAGIAAEAAQLLDSLAETDWPVCRVPGCFSLSVTALRRLPSPRQRNLIRYWLRRQGFQAPSALHLDQVMAQVASEPRSRQALVCWPEAEIWRYRDELMALKPHATTDSALKMSWNLRETLVIPGVGLLRAVAVHGDGLSQERVGKSPLVVGLRQGGEVCQLPGRSHHHKLKKLLQETSVPPWERHRLPLIYVDDELAAVGDRWVCEPYAARANEAGWKLRLELASNIKDPDK
ncbi:MAG: tRNA lysidine(34) synthetase TilS [Sulfuricaulis sp.]